MCVCECVSVCACMSVCVCMCECVCVCVCVCVRFVWYEADIWFWPMFTKTHTHTQITQKSSTDLESAPFNCARCTHHSIHQFISHLLSVLAGTLILLPHVVYTPAAAEAMQQTCKQTCVNAKH
jgi:hypothetical protein